MKRMVGAGTAFEKLSQIVVSNVSNVSGLGLRFEKLSQIVVSNVSNVSARMAEALR